MMEARELRIGNFFYCIDRSGNVHLPITSIVFKACSVGTTGVKAILSHQIEAQEAEYKFIRHSNTSPIPLTEEWLIKMGFNTEYNAGYIGIDVACTDFVLATPENKTDGGDGFRWLYNQGGVYLLTPLKYVHQLQNLFFSLTGEELTIKQ